MEDELNELRGRCQALEIMVVGFMAKEIDDEAEASGRDALEVLRERERGQIASLQLVTREIDARSDAAWSAMTETLRRLYQNAAGRLDPGS